jgi:hypothetical protein
LILYELLAHLGRRRSREETGSKVGEGLDSSS